MCLFLLSVLSQGFSITNVFHLHQQPFLALLHHLIQWILYLGDPPGWHMPQLGMVFLIPRLMRLLIPSLFLTLILRQPLEYVGSRLCKKRFSWHLSFPSVFVLPGLAKVSCLIGPSSSTSNLPSTQHCGITVYLMLIVRDRWCQHPSGMLLLPSLCHVCIVQQILIVAVMVAISPANVLLLQAYWSLLVAVGKVYPSGAELLWPLVVVSCLYDDSSMSVFKIVDLTHNWWLPIDFGGHFQHFLLVFLFLLCSNHHPCEAKGVKTRWREP